MRGTPHLHCGTRRKPGIIPAYAGNTDFNGEGAIAFGDHPRVCGEHLVLVVADRVVWGSSPRMRGTPFAGELVEGVGGIIPAYAGNTTPRMRNGSPYRDHPRVCGEHTRPTRHRVRLSGSSPRMRGTRQSRHRTTRRAGIIPAYAGNTRGSAADGWRWWDHPRVCGEHLYIQHADWDDPGSSPRMREHDMWYFIITADGGSSPRMRGTRCGFV